MSHHLRHGSHRTTPLPQGITLPPNTVRTHRPGQRVALFFIVPLFYALRLSLYVTRLVGGTTFAGLDNYKQVFQDAYFWEGVQRMAIFGIFQVPIMLGLALTFALMLDGGAARFKSLF